MSMIQDNKQNIQAFPFHYGTDIFTTGVTSYEIKGESKLVHVVDASTITIHFADTSSLQFEAVAGWDFVVTSDAQSFSSTAGCFIS